MKSNATTTNSETDKRPIQNEARQTARAASMNSKSTVSKREPHQITHVLNDLLANEFGLFTKTLNYHWNITGPRFHTLHVFLEEHYKALLIVLDDVAERVRILGGRPLSTMREFKSTMAIDEAPGEYPSADQMLADLMGDHEMIQKEIKGILTKYDDDLEDEPGIQDFLVDVLKQHEKFAWMLRAHLEV